MDEQAAKLEIERSILAVAKSYKNEKDFREGARIAAEKVPAKFIDLYSEYIYGKLEPPPEIRLELNETGSLTAWIDLLQFTIFEILYNYKSEAIEFLYKIGFGEYDWTQYQAIETLIRLANEGIEVNQTLEKIDASIDEFRYEALIPSLRALSTVKNQAIVETIFKRYLELYDEEHDRDYIETLQLFMQNYPETALRFADPLIRFARGAGMEGLRRFERDGFKVSAALTYYALIQDNDEINRILKELSETVRKPKYRTAIEDGMRQIDENKIIPDFAWFNEVF